MKKCILILFIILIVLTACEKSSINPNKIDGNWSIVHKFQDMHTFRSLFFADQNNGWVVGQTGKIMYTINGGFSWKFQNSGTTEDLFDVNFYDLKNGWIVGRNNTVLKTSNGGMSWKIVNIDQDTSQTFYNIQFTDKNNGWILSNHGKVFKTENSGQTWKLQLTWDNGGAGIIHFVNNEVGFIIPAIGNKLYQTSNGGLNWSTKSFDINISWERDIFFVDQSQGWICNDRSASSVAVDSASVFHTTDGGTNWKVVNKFDERFLMKLYFLDEYNGWVAGRKIYYTFDGGNTWGCQTKSTTTFFTDLQFINSSVGYALDYGGLIYKFQSN